MVSEKMCFTDGHGTMKALSTRATSIRQLKMFPSNHIANRYYLIKIRLELWSSGNRDCMMPGGWGRYLEKCVHWSHWQPLSPVFCLLKRTCELTICTSFLKPYRCGSYSRVSAPERRRHTTRDEVERRQDDITHEFLQQHNNVYRTHWLGETLRKLIKRNDRYVKYNSTDIVCHLHFTAFGASGRASGIGRRVSCFPHFSACTENGRPIWRHNNFIS